VIDNSNTIKEKRQCWPQIIGSGYHVDGVANTPWQCGPRVSALTASAGHDHRGSSGIVGTQAAHSFHRGTMIRHRDSVGGSSEGGRHSRLIPGLYPDECSHRTHESGNLLAGGQQRGATITAGKTEFKSLDTRLKGRPIAIDLLFRCAEILNSLFNIREESRCFLVFFIKPEFTLIKSGDFIFKGTELCCRSLSPSASTRHLLGESRRLNITRFKSLTRGCYLANESRQTFTTISDGAGGGLKSTLLRRQSSFGFGSISHSISEGRAIYLNCATKIELLGTRFTCLRLEFLRIAAGRRLAVVWLKMAHPLGGQ